MFGIIAMAACAISADPISNKLRPPVEFTRSDEITFVIVKGDFEYKSVKTPDGYVILVSGDGWSFKARRFQMQHNGMMFRLVANDDGTVKQAILSAATDKPK